MPILAIDTSSRGACCAIVERGVLRGEAASEETGTAEVLSQLIGQLSLDSGVQLPSLSRICVAVGPGSFTGIRSGLATAQGLGAALHIPVLGLSTLLAGTVQHARAGRSIAAVMPANAEESFLAAFSFERPEQEGQEARADQLVVHLLARAEVVPQRELGRRLLWLEGRLERSLEHCHIEAGPHLGGPGAGVENRAPYLARAAAMFVPTDLALQELGAHWQMSEKGLGLSPLYVKAAHAKTLAERRAGQ